MSEQTIRKNLLESKEWERKLDALIAAKETIDEETVNVTFDSNTKAELDFEFDKLLKIVEEKVKKLILRDAELGLYTLAPSKVKENIVYPEALEYLYKKATAEILQFYDKKTINKIGVMKDGIMYCKSRILESQTLRAVGELENVIDLQSFTSMYL